MAGDFAEAHLSIICMYTITTGIGLIGNVVSILIFTHPRMRKSSINVLLASLSISDFFVLVLGIPTMGLVPIMQAANHSASEIDLIQAYTAVSIYPLTLMAQTSSIWILILITIERFLAVCRPLLALRTCTPKRAKIAVVIVLLLAIMYNFVRFYEYKIVHNKNQNRTYGAKYLGGNMIYRYWYFLGMYMAFIFLLPFGFLLSMNVYVIYVLKKSQKDRESLTRHQVTEQKTTLMMVVVIVLFLLCNLMPNVITIIELVETDIFTAEYKELAYLVLDFTNLVIIVNCALNAFIYYYFSDRYRKVFNELAKCHYSVRNPLDVTQGTMHRSTVQGSPTICKSRSRDRLYDNETVAFLNGAQTRL